MRRQPIIKTDHGSDYEFIMALHINDLVSVNKNGLRVFYRVQKLEAGDNRIMFRLHTSTMLENKGEELRLTVNNSIFNTWQLQKHTTNAIGKLIV